MDPKLAQSIQLLQLSIAVGVCVGTVLGLAVWSSFKLIGRGLVRLYVFVNKKG
jgi:hypothetical protein